MTLLSTFILSNSVNVVGANALITLAPTSTVVRDTSPVPGVKVFTTTLHCRFTEQFISWQYTGCNNSVTETIVNSSCVVQPGYETVYSTDSTNIGQCDLTINSTTPTSAGSYCCVEDLSNCAYVLMFCKFLSCILAKYTQRLSVDMEG